MGRILRLIQFNQVYEILGLEPPNDVEVSVHEACKSEGIVSEVTVIEEIIPVEDNLNTSPPDTVVNERNLLQRNSAEENLAESSLQLEDNPNTTLPDTVVHVHNLLEGNTVEENLAESSFPLTLVLEESKNEESAIENIIEENKVFLEDNENQESATGDVTEESKVEVDISNAEL